MKKWITAIFFTFLIVNIPSSFAYIPPTNAYQQFNVTNETVTAPNYYASVKMVGQNGFAVTGSNSSQTIYFTAPNATAALPTKYCPANYGFVSYNATTNVITCGLLNQTGSGPTYDTMQNVGHGGYGFYKGNSTKTNFQFRNLTSTNTNTILTQNTTDVNIAVKGWQNNTGTNLGTHGIGPFSSMLGSVLQFFSLVSANNQLALSLNSTNIIFTIQHVITDAFKANSLTCAAGQFFSAFSNTTGTFTCTTPSTSGITSLNGQTGPSINLVRQAGNTTIKNNTNSIVIGIGPNVMAGGTNIGKGGKGFFSQIVTGQGQFRNLTSTDSHITISQNKTDLNIATNGLLSTAITSINSQAGPAITIQGTLNNVTATTTSNTVTLNTASNVVVTNGSPQNITKSLTLDAGVLGGNLNAHSFQISTLLNATHKNDATTARQLGLLGNLTSGSKCSDGQFIQYKNSNQTWICRTLANSTGSGITSINSQTGPTMIILHHSNATTITNSSNVLTLSLKNNVLLTNGTKQTATKYVAFNDQAKITGLLLNASATQTNSYTATSTDDLINVNATNGNYTVTIPSISIAGTGKIYTIKKVDYSKNYVEIVPTLSSIEDFKNMNLTNPSDTLSIENNGTIWFGIVKPSSSYLTFPLKQGSNAWFGPWVNQGTPATLTTVNNTLYAVPFTLTRPVSLAKIESEVSTSGNSNCRMAIYADSGSGYPTNKIVNSDIASLVGSPTGTMVNTFTKNIRLQTGNYYLAEECNGGSFSIAKDTISSVTTANNANSATQTISITIANNINRLLIVGITYHGDVSGDNISTVKIGSTSFTFAGHVCETSCPSTVDESIWYLINPPSGAQTITITPSFSAQYDLQAAAYSLYNVNQVTGVQTVTTHVGTSSPSSITITPTITGSWVVEGVFFDPTVAGNPTAPTFTQAWVSHANGAYTSISGGSQYDTTPTINAGNTMGWTEANMVGRPWGEIAVEVLKAAPNTTLRAIPPNSLSSFLGMINTMGATNGGTMYSVTTSLGSIPSPLPDPFPSGATIATSSVPEILVNVVG